MKGERGKKKGGKGKEEREMGEKGKGGKGENVLCTVSFIDIGSLSLCKKS